MTDRGATQAQDDDDMENYVRNARLPAGNLAAGLALPVQDRGDVNHSESNAMASNRKSDQPQVEEGSNNPEVEEKEKVQRYLQET